MGGHSGWNGKGYWKNNPSKMDKGIGWTFLEKWVKVLEGHCKINGTGARKENGPETGPSQLRRIAM